MDLVVRRASAIAVISDSLASRLAFNASNHAGPLLADAANAPPHSTPCIRLNSTEFN
jgi:hypothetical protein